MGEKYCVKCNKRIEMNIFVCPECSSESFFHHDPNLPFPYAGTPPVDDNKVFPWQLPPEPKTVKTIDPEKLEKFQARFSKELEELEYLEWRSRQPGWRDPDLQKRMKGITATAAGVALGTAALRGQLGDIKSAITDDGSGEDSGWFGDLFN